MTLAGFLTARLDEDEAEARAAEDVAASPWIWQHLLPPYKYGLVGVHPIQPRQQSLILPSEWSDVYPHRDTAAYIAHHDPARTLAEVDAKRQIVGWFNSGPGYHARIGSGWPEHHEQIEHTEKVLERVLRLLALPYSGHPDYQQEWRP